MRAWWRAGRGANPRRESARSLECRWKALRLAEEVGDSAWTARTLDSVGWAHGQIGDTAVALELHERALPLHRAAGASRRAGNCLLCLGIVQHEAGRLDDALATFDAAAEQFAEAGSARGRAAAWLDRAMVLNDLGRWRESIAFCRRAWPALEEAGDVPGRLELLWTMGRAHAELGEFDDALRCADARAVVRPGRGGHSDLLRGLVAERRGDAAAALPYLKRAVRGLTRTARGQAQEQGAHMRGRTSEHAETGIRAAVRAGSVADFVWFAEHGRAGTLLESLSGRDAMRRAAVPERLLRAEARARVATATTHARYREALATGKLDGIVACRRDVDRARQDLKSALEAIQRFLKRDLAYPEPASLGELEAASVAGRVLVIYAVAHGESFAAVIGDGKTRVVALGSTARLDAAARALAAACARPGSAWRSPARRFRVLVAWPLALAPAVARVVVAPTGTLSSAPLALAFPARELCVVPSGSTALHLAQRRGARGDSVLALGDPDYGVPPAAALLTVMRSGADLAPLPASRAEARAVGDRVLLGEDATEDGFVRALREAQAHLRTREQWGHPFYWAAWQLWGLGG